MTLSETLQEVHKSQTELRKLDIHKDEAKDLDTAINTIRVKFAIFFWELGKLDFFINKIKYLIDLFQSDVSLMDSLYEQVVKIDQLQSRLSAQLQKFESDMRNADQFKRDIQNLQVGKITFS